MKIVTVVGARPQFVKAAAVSRAIEKRNQEHPKNPIREVLVHTGQHYDENMSRVFFDELEIKHPDYNLEVGSGSHGRMTGLMLAKIEDLLLEETPDAVVIYGDTNSTLAGALAAAKLHIPVAHVEAGLRSFNRRMPEEINRVLSDHIATLLFCPTMAAVSNLKTEGIERGVHRVGDVMYDSFCFYKKLAEKKASIHARLATGNGPYALVTVHREENTDDGERLSGIFEAIFSLAGPECPFIVPLHPRTRKALDQGHLTLPAGDHVRLIEPVSYLNMVALETHASVILTDSGGVQKEAYFSGVPCITLRDETEWVELVEAGANVLSGCEPEKIGRAFGRVLGKTVSIDPELYGGGRASERIVEYLQSIVK